MSQFPFILVPQGQRKATSEVKRSIRSHAAIVSRPDPATTKRAKPRLHKAEQIISFDDKASIATNVSEDDKAHSTRTASASTLVPTDSESNLAQSTFRSSLACDVLSGEIFSPVSQLATFRKPYLPGILNHYFHHLVIPAALNSTGVSAPTFQETWFPIVVVDPLIFEVVVLFAATHFATYSKAANLEQLSRELLFLKQSALAALIRRVQLEKRRSLTGVMSPYADYSFHGCSDILIAASVKLASYEAIFGSVDAFHIHMSAVARLLHQRADLSTLGMNGFLAQMLAFVDINSAALLGSDMYLQGFGLPNYKYTPHQSSAQAPRLEELTGCSMPSLPNSDPVNVASSPTSMEGLNIESFIGSKDIARVRARLQL